MQICANSGTRVIIIDKKQNYEASNSNCGDGRCTLSSSAIAGKSFILRLITIFLLVTCLQVNAKEAGYAHVTISVENVSVEEVFEVRLKQTEYGLLYADEMVNMAEEGKGTKKLTFANVNGEFRFKEIELDAVLEMGVLGTESYEYLTFGGRSVPGVFLVKGRVIIEKGPGVNKFYRILFNRLTLVSYQYSFFFRRTITPNRILRLIQCSRGDLLFRRN